MSQKFCGNCGSKLVLEGSFCQNCGTKKVSVTGAIQKIQDQPNDDRNYHAVKSLATKSWLKPLIVLCILVAAGLLIFFSKNFWQPSTDAGNTDPNSQQTPADSRYDVSKQMGSDAQDQAYNQMQWKLFGTAKDQCVALSTQYAYTNYEGFIDGCVSEAGTH